LYFGKNPPISLVDGFSDTSFVSIGYLSTVTGAYDSFGIVAAVNRATLKAQHHPTHGGNVNAMC
jgi:hypothetical protein